MVIFVQYIFPILYIILHGEHLKNAECSYYKVEQNHNML